MNRHQFAHPLGGGGARIDSGPDCSDVPSQFYGHETGVGAFLADQGHIGCFRGGIRSLDRSDKTPRLYESEGIIKHEFLFTYSALWVRDNRIVPDS